MVWVNDVVFVTNRGLNVKMLHVTLSLDLCVCSYTCLRCVRVWSYMLKVWIIMFQVNALAACAYVIFMCVCICCVHLCVYACLLAECMLGTGEFMYVRTYVRRFDIHNGDDA